MSAVWYVGPNAVRGISSQAWARLGFPGRDARVWSEGNSWSIPTRAFTADQLAWLYAHPAEWQEGSDGPRPGTLDPPEPPAGENWDPGNRPASINFVNDAIATAIDGLGQHADLHEEKTFAQASLIWRWDHNLGVTPSVTLMLPDRSEFDSYIRHNGPDYTEAQHYVPVAGIMALS